MHSYIALNYGVKSPNLEISPAESQYSRDGDEHIKKRQEIRVPQFRSGESTSFPSTAPNDGWIWLAYWGASTSVFLLAFAAWIKEGADNPRKNNRMRIMFQAFPSCYKNQQSPSLHSVCFFGGLILSNLHLAPTEPDRSERPHKSTGGSQHWSSPHCRRCAWVKLPLWEWLTVCYWKWPLK